MLCALKSSNSPLGQKWQQWSSRIIVIIIIIIQQRELRAESIITELDSTGRKGITISKGPITMLHIQRELVTRLLIERGLVTSLLIERGFITGYISVSDEGRLEETSRKGEGPEEQVVP